MKVGDLVIYTYDHKQQTGGISCGIGLVMRQWQDVITGEVESRILWNDGDIADILSCHLEVLNAESKLYIAQPPPF